MNWLIIRGSGLVAFWLLSLSAIWGLLLANKIKMKFLKAKALTYAHESLAIGSVLATIIHMVALYVDDFVEFGAADILVPGSSNWEPAAVAFGIVGFYVLVIVTVSFYIKKMIGQKIWRAVHFLSFGSFASVLAHGVMAGTDTSHPIVYWSYIAVTAVVAGLIAMRILQPAKPARRARPNHRTEDAAGSDTDRIPIPADAAAVEAG